MKPQNKFNLWYWVAAFFAILVIQYSSRKPAGRQHPLQRVPATAARRQGRGGRHLRPLHPGHVEGATGRAAEAFVTTRVEPDIAQELEPLRRPLHRPDREHAAARHPVLGPAVLLFFGVWVFLDAPAGRPGRGMGGGLMPIGKSKAKVYVETDTGVTLQGRGRRRRGQGRAAGGRRLPARTRAVRPPRRAHAQGRAAGRPARHRQDPAGQGRGRRGQGAVLLHLRLRVRRDVRRRRRGPRARPLRAGAREGPRHHLHRRAGRARPRPRRSAALGAAATTRRSRP